MAQIQVRAFTTETPRGCNSGDQATCEVSDIGGDKRHPGKKAMRFRLNPRASLKYCGNQKHRTTRWVSQSSAKNDAHTFRSRAS